ncbi:MAG: 2'-5' RNA ligase family protein [Segetibacter sp.]
MIQPPLILTLSIEKEATLFFNSLRKKHFPPSRNFIDAHLTLFHALPNEVEIINTVKDLCNLQKPFELIIKEVVSIGKGVAYKIESNELMQLHKSLQYKWQNFLSLQDRQKLWPHITIQNKVPLQEVKQLLYELKNNFTPFSTSATGLQLWEYLNGPWKLVEYFVFKQVQT